MLELLGMKSFWLIAAPVAAWLVWDFYFGGILPFTKAKKDR